MFIFLAAFMVLKPMIPIIEYVTNFQYISTVLCENKNKPKMHCNGKCHLKKNLKKTFEADGSTPASDKVNFLTEWIILFLNPVESIEMIPDLSPELQHASLVRNTYEYLYSSDLLHPPS